MDRVVSKTPISLNLSLPTRGKAALREPYAMSLRLKLFTGLCTLAMLSSQVVAEAPQEGKHLAYYTYYKTRTGETVSGVAAKFGLAPTSLLKMNPQLGEEVDTLPDGSMLCVPQAKDESASLPKPKVKKTTKVESSQKSSKKTEDKPAQKSSSKKKKESEEPDEDEWESLAELATKGAPKMAIRAADPLPPASKLIRPNGEVVWIPAAKPKPAPVVKRESNKRVELASRKGKAIHGVLNTCRSYIGTPYVWGGELPGGFDCSGYVQYVFARHGYSLPRTADIQFEVGDVVRRGDEKPGDLVFFETYAPGASHVGVYLGRDYFIHASSSRGVTIDRLSTDFFAQRYLGAKRNSY